MMSLHSAWCEGNHNNPVSGTHQAPSHWEPRWKILYLLTKTHPEERKGWEQNWRVATQSTLNRSQSFAASPEMKCPLLQTRSRYKISSVKSSLLVAEFYILPLYSEVSELFGTLSFIDYNTWDTKKLTFSTLDRLFPVLFPQLMTR